MEGTAFTWSDPRTFYLPASEWGGTVSVTGDDAHHIVHVLRLGAGAEIRLMDGCGREGAFVIESVARNEVRCRLERDWTHGRPDSGLVVAAAWTKAARRSWIFEKSVEFGAAGIWFWQAERSQFPVPDAGKEQWHARMVAGLKQCRNPWLPVVRTLPGGAGEVIRTADAEGVDRRHVLLESTLGPSPMLDGDRLALPGTTLCVIGPEGGFSPVESERFVAAGFEPFSLGRRVLRWETAAVLCLGLHWWRAEDRAAAR